MKDAGKLLILFIHLGDPNICIEASYEGEYSASMAFLSALEW